MHRESASASATAEPLGNSLLADQREEGEGELSLPQDLLERSSSVSSGSGEESELETQSDGEDEQGSEEKEGQLSLISPLYGSKYWTFPHYEQYFVHCKCRN